MTPTRQMRVSNNFKVIIFIQYKKVHKNMHVHCTNTFKLHQSQGLFVGVGSEWNVNSRYIRLFR